LRWGERNLDNERALLAEAEDMPSVSIGINLPRNVGAVHGVDTTPQQKRCLCLKVAALHLAGGWSWVCDAASNGPV